MEYKKGGKKMSFADLDVKKSIEHNLSLKMMERINTSVTWENIEAPLGRILRHWKSHTGC